MLPHDRIVEAVAPLVGKPMWAAGRAGLVWMQFGEVVTIEDRGGRTREVGEYAFHIQCRWRWVEASGEARADDRSSHDELSHLGERHPVCEAITTGASIGALSLDFSDRSVLHVEPGDPELDEYWRIFSFKNGTPHFVVGRNGIEPVRGS